VLSSIIAGNTTTGIGPDVYKNSGTTVSLGHNLIGDGTSSGLTAATGDQIGTGVSPINAQLGALSNNGGSTQTLAITPPVPAYQKGDCSGNNTVTPNAPAVTTDQRGQNRKVSCDVGAFEYNPSPTPTPTTTPVPIKPDTIGIYRNGRSSCATGIPLVTLM